MNRTLFCKAVVAGGWYKFKGMKASVRFTSVYLTSGVSHGSVPHLTEQVREENSIPILSTLPELNLNVFVNQIKETQYET